VGDAGFGAAQLLPCPALPCPATQALIQALHTHLNQFWHPGAAGHERLRPLYASHSQAAATARAGGCLCQLALLPLHQLTPLVCCSKPLCNRLQADG
jgi:hypothetical protein